MAERSTAVPGTQVGPSLVDMLISLLVVVLVTLAASQAFMATRGILQDPLRNLLWPVPDWHAATASHRVLPDGRVHMQMRIELSNAQYQRYRRRGECRLRGEGINWHTNGRRRLACEFSGALNLRLRCRNAARVVGSG